MLNPSFEDKGNNLRRILKRNLSSKETLRKDHFEIGCL